MGEERRGNQKSKGKGQRSKLKRENDKRRVMARGAT
jgi:hypothetical protein